MRMSEEKKNFETWEEVIIDFLQRKSKAEEENYLKEVIKAVGKQYSNQKYFNNSEIEEFFNIRKNKKNESQSSIEFQQLKFQSMFDFDEKPNEFNQSKQEEAYFERCTELKEKYKPNTWISKASNDASSVSFATHVIKLTHSRIDSPSFFDQIQAQKDGLLTTSGLKEKIIDGAVAGNQFAPVFQFLELELKGNKLAPVFADESNTVLQSFTEKPEELSLWNAGFKRALADNQLSSHFLAKQIYFPIRQTNSLSIEPYHLLCNVKSSSLAHAIFEKLRDTEQKKIEKSRAKNKYSILPKTSFPEKASIAVTKSNHGNASQLNGKRGGQLKLFNSSPPIWESQLKPPVFQASFFYAGLNSYKVKEAIDFLRDFLIRFQKIDLSIKDPKKKKWIDSWVNHIVDEILLYAASIQNLRAGWSNEEGVKLKLEHQCFLDPYRDDEAFQKARQSTDWQTVICSDFANWLNGRLKGKDKKFTPQREHTRMWKKIMEKELREYAQTIDADIKFQNRGQKA